MANTSAISRGSLIIGLCLPLAVLLGYLLAEPMDSTTIGLVVLLLSVFSIPILMRWHHPLLIISWNACVNPFFFPGRPYLWMLMALTSCFFAMLSRATDAKRRFLSAPQLTASLLALLGVVLVTAFMRGGVGLGIFGSDVQGGRGYFFITFAIIGYFALTSQAVPVEQGGWYVTVFLLSGLTAVISNLAYLGGSQFYFLFDLFPVDIAATQAMGDLSMTGGATRIIGLTVATQSVWLWLFARYGVAGVLDLSHPWRLLLLGATVFGGMLGGFRSMFIVLGLLFVLLFWMEGLWRSPKVMTILLLGMAALSLSLILFSEHLPLSAQRALSFLPLRLDAAVRQDADFSTQWRFEIWRRVLPDVPRYFFKGKGYVLDPNDLYLANESVQRGYDSGSGVAEVAGDYHSGPLTLVIPFGIWGVLAFVWFLSAAIWVAYRNYKYGNDALRGYNRFLLALLIAKAVGFVLVYGSLYGDLFQFTGLAGLTVCLNGGVARPDTNRKLQPSH